MFNLTIKCFTIPQFHYLTILPLNWYNNFLKLPWYLVYSFMFLVDLHYTLFQSIWANTKNQAWINKTVITWALPSKPFITLLWFRNEWSITFLILEIWPSCIIAFQVCHYLAVVLVNKSSYSEGINHSHHITRYLQLPYSIHTMIEIFQVDHYVVLSSEITITISDGWQNIKSCINKHIIHRAMINWRPYCITTFESIHITNKDLNHFINGEINTGIFYWLKLW